MTTPMILAALAVALPSLHEAPRLALHAAPHAATAWVEDAPAERIFTITVSFLFADVELGPDDANLRMHKLGGAVDPDAVPTLHLASEGEFRVDDDRWYLRLGDTHSISGKMDDPMVAFAMALASPRISVREGGTAKVMMGEQVPYLERRPDGAFALRTRDDLTEGLTVEVMEPRATETGVVFERFAMRISEVIGREDVEGLPFDAGRPIVKATEVSFAPEIPRDHIALVRVPGFVHEEGLLYLAIDVREED